MSTTTMDHATLIKPSKPGVARKVQVIGQPAGCAVLVQYGVTERILAAQRSHLVRWFHKLDTSVLYPQSAGIPHFSVDAAHYTAHSGHQPNRSDWTVPQPRLISRK